MISMGERMLLQGAHLAKRALADIACERFFSRVNHYVPLEVRAAAEHAIAVIADERLFVAIETWDDLFQCHVLGLLRGFGAFACGTLGGICRRRWIPMARHTFELFFRAVNASMLLQIAELTKSATTDIASVRFFTYTSKMTFEFL